MSIRRNTVVNLCGALIPMAVMLVTVPLYIRILGDARFGVLSLVWLALGYFAFLEMGLGKATSNQIAQAEKAPPSVRSEILWTALSINAAMGLLGAALMWILGNILLAHFLHTTNAFRLEVRAALPWMAATLPLALISSVLNGALEGRNRFLELNVLQIITSALFQLVPLLVASRLGSSLAIVIPAAVVTRASMNLLFFAACCRYVPLTGHPAPCRERAMEQFKYGGWVAVTAAAGPLLETLDRFIIGATLGVAAVTHYIVPTQLVGKLRVVPGAMARALFPRFSSSSPEEAQSMATSSIQFLSVAMTALVIVCTLALRPFLDFWIGPNISHYSAPIGEILLIGIWFNSLAHVPYFFLQARGRPDIVAKIHALELPVFAVAAWGASILAGLRGVAVVWSLRCAIEAFLLFGLAGLFKATLKGPAIQALIIIGMTTAIQCLPGANISIRFVIALCIAAFALYKFKTYFYSFRHSKSYNS
nr:oligosaccharide flippase family protein [uncultured Holophaga sp.]